MKKVVLVLVLVFSVVAAAADDADCVAVDKNGKTKRICVDVAKTAVEAYCPPTGKYPPKRTICIDAATGAILGETRFSRYDKVDIWIANLNPLHFSYRFSANQTVLGGSTGLGDIIGALGFSPIAAATLANDTQKATAAAAKPAKSNAKLANTSVPNVATSVDPVTQALDSALTLQDEVVRATNKFAAITESLKRKAVGQAGIRGAWELLKRMVGQDADKSAKAPDPADLAESIRALKDAVTNAGKSDPAMNDTITGLAQTLTTYRTTFGDLNKLTEQLATLFPSSGEQEAFRQHFRIARDVDNGRTVDLKLEIAELDSTGKPGDFATLAEETIQMGSQIFTRRWARRKFQANHAPIHDGQGRRVVHSAKEKLLVFRQSVAQSDASSRKRWRDQLDEAPVDREDKR